MEKLLAGLHKFQDEAFRDHQELFGRLEHGQSPDTLFITCSDSRINPNLLTQTNPGELFILRNAGNIIPPYSLGSGEAATIEFAVAKLKVKDIIICGHSHCGAVNGIMHPHIVEELPALRAWLHNSQAVHYLVAKNYPEIAKDDDRTINVAIQENVLLQIENLKTHPCIQKGVADGTLKLHAWVYKFESGQVFSYEPKAEQFLALVAPDASKERRKARFVTTGAETI